MSMSIDQQQPSSQSCWTWQQTSMDCSQHSYYYYPHSQQQFGREHMFEKPLTPSDVGKLNRLVIPKQHAERYFPIDSESGEKGLLLSFEDDEGGKTWKFRYSYWTSSQSYVLTKGWSRFVKEKMLDAGDVVLFERCRPGSNDDRLFIGCRRRGSTASDETATESTNANATTTASTNANAALSWGPTFGSSGYPVPYFYMNSASPGEGGSEETAVTAAAAAGSPVGSSRRRLRLFGVNLECGPEPQQQLVSSGSWSQFSNNACLMPPSQL